MLNAYYPKITIPANTDSDWRGSNVAAPNELKNKRRGCSR